MANHAYLRVWTRDFSVETMLAEFARFLTTAPLSPTQNTFTELAVQAVDATETPVAEWDLRPVHAGPAEVAAMSVQYLNSDTAYIVGGEMGSLGARHRDPALATQAGTAGADLPRAGI